MSHVEERKLIPTAQHPADAQAHTLADGNSAGQGRWFWVLAVALVLLYAAGVNQYWRVQRDSALYLCLGRSLAEGQGYLYNYQPHTLALPAFPLIIAAVFRIFGESFLALNILMHLMGLACVVLSWMLLKELGLPKSALAASMLLIGFSRLLYYYSAHILTDVPFTMFALLALWSGERMLHAEGRAFWLWSTAAAALCVCATAMRPFGLALAVAMVGALWLSPHRRRQWRRNAAASALLLGALALFVCLWMQRNARVATPDSATYMIAFRQGRLPQLAAWAVGVIPKLLESIGEAVCGVGVTWVGGLLLSLLILWGLARLFVCGKPLLPLYVAVYLAGTCLSQPGRRYMMPVLPALCCASVMGAQAAAGWLHSRRPIAPTRTRLALHALLAILVMANVVRIGKVVIENRTPDFYARLDSGRWRRYFDAAEWLKQNAGPDEIVIGYEGRLVHFLTRLRTVQLPPDTSPLEASQMRDMMLKQNVRYAIIDDRRAPSTAALEQLLRQRPQAAQSCFGEAGLLIVRINSVELELDR